MPEGPLTGRVALITGGGGLIGSGIARCFGRAGASVVVHYRDNERRAREVADDVTRHGGDATVLRADLTVEGECRGLVAEAASWRGRLDALVNNAGIQPVRQLGDLGLDEWRTVLETNVSSPFVATQAAAEIMSAQGGGSITHIASIEGGRPASGHAHYSSSKAALIMHARAAALEYGARGIRVNAVSPGVIERPGIAEQWPEGVAGWLARTPSGRLGQPEDVGRACVFLASDAASWISGVDLPVDGGASVCPGW
ncbi:SDR family NAD(P)-dependent oxidoreductase [Streptomyces sp. NPDC048297]|uniref:SDR family NAD(P)-dependent oxidoreductase n=1 Tax=Streptomyces sp. NPDC048297 TaxID=3365531 RepID=UPI003713D31F